MISSNNSEATIYFNLYFVQNSPAAMKQTQLRITDDEEPKKQ